MIPITICLFTTSKGHFGRTDRYLQTLNHLNSQIPLNQFGGLIANIKVSPEDADSELLVKMRNDLKGFGFTVYESVAGWKHHDESHQNEYGKDIISTYLRKIDTEYVLHLEDDFLFCAQQKDLLYWFHRSIKLLEEDPDLLQVRFARFTNEYQRINRLKFKHGIDAACEDGDDDTWFRHNDFSLNPSIFRTRDIRAAVILWQRNMKQTGNHVEMGFSQAVKYFSQKKLCFAFFHTVFVKTAHIGCKIGEEEQCDGSYLSD